jgi:hypothetical protein
MKSKKLTYVLGFLVLLVWGLIIYRLFKAAGGDGESLPISSHAEMKEASTDYTLPKDTTHLLLDYRDPFSVKKSEPVEIPVNQLIQKKSLSVIQKPMVNWNVIRYSGFIHNPGSKKLIALLNINGEELMMSEGETADQVKLIKNLKDSIKVTYQGATKFIILNTKSP